MNFLVEYPVGSSTLLSVLGVQIVHDPWNFSLICERSCEPRFSNIPVAVQSMMGSCTTATTLCFPIVTLTAALVPQMHANYDLSNHPRCRYWKANCVSKNYSKHDANMSKFVTMLNSVCQPKTLEKWFQWLWQLNHLAWWPTESCRRRAAESTIHRHKVQFPKPTYGRIQSPCRHASTEGANNNPTLPFVLCFAEIQHGRRPTRDGRWNGNDRTEDDVELVLQQTPLNQLKEDSDDGSWTHSFPLTTQNFESLNYHRTATSTKNDGCRINLVCVVLHDWFYLHHF